MRVLTRCAKMREISGWIRVPPPAPAFTRAQQRVKAAALKPKAKAKAGSCILLRSDARLFSFVPFPVPFPFAHHPLCAGPPPLPERFSTKKEARVCTLASVILGY